MLPRFILSALVSGLLAACTPTIRLAPSASSVRLSVATPGNYSNRQQLYHDGRSGKDFLVVADADRQQLTAYDLRTQQAAWQVPLPPALVAHLTYVKFRVQSPDSVFVLDRASQQLLLLGGNGGLRRHWNVRTPGLALSELPQPLFYRAGQLYAQQAATVRRFFTEAADRDQFYRTPPLVRLNLRDSLPARQAMGAFPAWFTARQTYATFQPNATLNGRGEWLISYAASDSLWLCDATGLRRAVQARSRWHRPAQPFPSDSLTNEKYLEEYGITQSQYHTLTYDPYRRLYYRVYIHGIPYRRADGTLQTTDDQPWSLLVLDEALRVRGETLMPAHYDYNTVLPVPDGVWIGSHRAGHPGFNPQQLQLTLFTHVSR